MGQEISTVTMICCGAVYADVAASMDHECEEILNEEIVWEGSVCIFCGDALETPDPYRAGTIHKNGKYACHVADDKGKLHRLDTVATRR